jgi:hypothetical protein
LKEESRDTSKNKFNVSLSPQEKAKAFKTVEDPAPISLQKVEATDPQTSKIETQEEKATMSTKKDTISSKLFTAPVSRQTQRVKKLKPTSANETASIKQQSDSLTTTQQIVRFKSDDSDSIKNDY